MIGWKSFRWNKVDVLDDFSGDCYSILREWCKFPGHYLAFQLRPKLHCFRIAAGIRGYNVPCGRHNKRQTKLREEGCTSFDGNETTMWFNFVLPGNGILKMGIRRFSI